MTEEKKSNAGRKKLIITADMIEQAETLGAQGMTTMQIASALGMGESTIYEKMNKYSEFKEAIKRGKDKGIAMVTERLLDKCMAMDTTSILFYLKCQAGWRDTQELELSANGNNKLEIVITGGSPTSE